ncbi:PASTA domain-containing protein, partial [Actinotalea ferrariae]|uniref:PASTA domain-containing protein n=1 Tax=Actinotalea ferrariae TaxID=1386098 RepID=UPI001C8BB13C
DDDPHATETIHVAAGRARPGRTAADPSSDEHPDGALGRTMALRIGSGLDGPGEPEPAGAVGSRPGRRAALLATVLLVLALAAGGVWWYATSGPGAYTEVPAGVEGVLLAEAEAALDAAGLGTTVAEDFDPTVPAGVVVSTDPGPGERVRKDGTVEIVVSKGPDLRTVPEGLAGAPLADAVAALEAVGLVAQEPVREYHDEVPADHVIAVGAEPLAQLPVGTEVALTVSDGREPVTVISVIGATREDAVQGLQDQGLVVTEEPGYSTEFAAGTVMAQSLAPDAQAHRLDPITITVSQGPPLVEVPDVFGQQFGAARTALEALGLVVARENLLGGVFGTVHSQDVAAGTAVPVGSTVTLRVI